MVPKATLLVATLAAMLVGCDASSVLVPPPDPPSDPPLFGDHPPLEASGCTGYLVMAIWGQSNAARGDRAFEVLADPSQLDTALVTDAGHPVVMRWDGGAGEVPFAYVRSEDRDGAITDVSGPPERRYTAYVDLGNRLYERFGYCVVFVPYAFGGSAMQVAAMPANQQGGRDKVWDPDHPNGLFQPALAELDAAVAYFDPALLFVYWSQGTRDALVMSPDHPPQNAHGASAEGWRAAFLRLADALRDHFAGNHPAVRPIEVLLTLDATFRCTPEDVGVAALHGAQRAAAADRAHVHVVSEVMPDPTTYPGYVDDKHLRWSQYRYCENPAVADGLANVLDPVPGWQPRHTCAQTYPPPQCEGGLATVEGE